MSATVGYRVLGGRSADLDDIYEELMERDWETIERFHLEDSHPDVRGSRKIREMLPDVRKDYDGKDEVIILGGVRDPQAYLLDDAIMIRKDIDEESQENLRNLYWGRYI